MLTPPVPARVPLRRSVYDAPQQATNPATSPSVDPAALFAAIPNDRCAVANALAASQAWPACAVQPPARSAADKQRDRAARRLFAAIPDEIYTALDTPKPPIPRKPVALPAASLVRQPLPKSKMCAKIRSKIRSFKRRFVWP